MTDFMISILGTTNTGLFTVGIHNTVRHFWFGALSVWGPLQSLADGRERIKKGEIEEE